MNDDEPIWVLPAVLILSILASIGIGFVLNHVVLLIARS